MDIILGLLVIFVIYLAIENIWVVVGIGAVVAIIWLVVNIAKMDSDKGKNSNTVTTASRAPSDKCSAGYCKYYNLSKAEEAGYKSGYCYCKYLNQIVALKTDCPHYKRLGCAVTFCDHADFSAGKKIGRGGNVCYCKYYGEYREAQQSCPGYTSEETDALLGGLVRKK